MSFEKAGMALSAAWAGQCHGVTKAGKRCEYSAGVSGYCQHHKKQGGSIDRLESAIDRVVERMIRVYDREQRHLEEEMKPDPNQVKQAYDALIDLGVPDDALLEFETRYGVDEFARRTQLAMRQAMR